MKSDYPQSHIPARFPTWHTQHRLLGAFLGKDNVSILSRATRKKNVRRTPAFLLLHRRPSLLVFARLPAPRTGKGSSRIAR